MTFVLWLLTFLGGVLSGIGAVRWALIRDRKAAGRVKPPPPAVVEVVQERFSDPGKQALQMLRRGDDCDWYSIKHDHGEIHEAFDCLEIYWRTEVEHSDLNVLGWGRGPFESKAGFRVRWHVAATNKSYVEAYGLDLMTTILEARELTDRAVERSARVIDMGYKHPELEAWKARGAEREYSFHGLDLEKWAVSVVYPGGRAWAEDPDLDCAVADALTRVPS